MDNLMQLLRWKSKLLPRVPNHFEYPRDPDDEPYLNLAIEAQVEYLITREKDLLDLMKWETEEGREFQKQFRFLRIVNPVVFLQLIDQGEPEKRVLEIQEQAERQAPISEEEI